jgi:ATP-dependent HslUV protease ATP-binding subunit HslU
LLENINRGRRKTKQITVAEARKLLEKQQGDVDADTIAQIAVHSVQQDGIVFIDEIDKICERKDSVHRSADASSEGVQRDLLPIIEGSVVHTKHGNVNTSHILFIASGAFHSNKPSDMISELQGRLPIRVELKPLETIDLYRYV